MFTAGRFDMAATNILSYSCGYMLRSVKIDGLTVSLMKKKSFD